jgi:hypothetical protein
MHIYDTYPLNYVVNETMQGGSTKVDKKACQGENLGNLIVGRP